MNTNSLIQKLGFTIADLISTKGSSLSTRCDPTRYFVSDRLYEALRIEAKASKRLVSSLVRDLREEVCANYKHENGPMAEALGFEVADLFTQGGLCMRFADDPNQYAISQRLKDAIAEVATKRQVRNSTVFFELQEELLGMTVVAA